jgi:2,4-dienoyl-CoA reductase-like NADH-dependent reductase (Old Yellow Enzyme family)
LPELEIHLGERNIAFLFTREYQADDSVTPAIRKAFGGVLIANEKYTVESAEKAVADGAVDAVAWGQAYVANSDLVSRIARRAPWNTINFATAYCGPGVTSQGYTDYPTLEQVEAA